MFSSVCHTTGRRPLRKRASLRRIVENGWERGSIKSREMYEPACRLIGSTGNAVFVPFQYPPYADCPLTADLTIAG